MSEAEQMFAELTMRMAGGDERLTVWLRELGAIVMRTELGQRENRVLMVGAYTFMYEEITTLLCYENRIEKPASSTN